MKIDQLCFISLKATSIFVFINSFFIFCVSFYKGINSVACLLYTSFFIFGVSFYKRMNSIACLPACQTPAHQTEYSNASDDDLQ